MPSASRTPRPTLYALGVVAEEREVAGAAARRHAVGDRHRQAAEALLRQPVEVRNMRLLQLGAAALVRQAAEAVDDEQQDLRVAGDGQFAQQFEIHAGILPAVVA